MRLFTARVASEVAFGVAVRSGGIVIAAVAAPEALQRSPGVALNAVDRKMLVADQSLDHRITMTDSRNAIALSPSATVRGSR
jgi:hypothetical protein